MTRQSTRIQYLGPQGSFTHQAAIESAAEASRRLHMDVADFEFVACDTVPQILHAVELGQGWGTIAWENNVEGFVVPNLDLMMDAADAAGFLRVGVNVRFDAFVTERTYRHACEQYASEIAVDDAQIPARDNANAYGAASTPPTIDELAIRDCTAVCAHSHGLAQCRRFAREHGLKPVPAASNAAACRDLQDFQIALGPSICANIYGLHRVAANVGDFDGARTEFLTIAPRSQVVERLRIPRSDPKTEFESVIAFIPLVTGPGVLANLLDVLRDAQLNMVSLISRPVKGRDGTYSFLATLDAAPWDERFVNALVEICEHGDWVRTLAVYPRDERNYPTVSEWMLPAGGVRFEGEPHMANWRESADVRKELLW